MTQEVVRTLREIEEEAATVLVQKAVESRYHVHVEELVEESAASFPMGSVTVHGEVPRVHVHA